METDLPLACVLPERALAVRRQQVIGPLFGGVQQIHELADGYSLIFPGHAEWLARLAEFVAFERQCCPFLTFELICAPAHGPIRLNIRGPEGAKAILQSELEILGAALSSEVSRI